MVRSEVLEKVFTVVADKLGLEKEEGIHEGVKFIVWKNKEGVSLTEETDLANDLGADSLDGVEIVMGLEEVFGIDIPDEAANQFSTVCAIVRYLFERQDGESATPEAA